MRKLTQCSSIAVVSAGLIAGAFVAGAQSASANGVNGDYCLLSYATSVYATPSYSATVLYTLNAGTGIRLDSTAGSDWWRGHANGLSQGFVPNDNRYYNCTP